MAIYLDTETTGLSPRQGATIVELAIVDEKGKPLINTLVDPKSPIPWQASKVHGITDDMVRGKPSLKDLMPEIRGIVRDKQVVIYNSTFDAPFFPGSLSEAKSIDCAMRQFSQVTGSRSWRKLDYAASHVGHTWSGVAHRALADALACRSVWNWIQKKGANTLNHEHLQPVIKRCTSCSKQLRMPAGKLLDVICPNCNHKFRVQT
jgi:DNA polymerase III epsilon subunit-like protein